MLYFLRHAESTANSGEKDELDVGLSENGFQQAKLLEGNYDLIICSPLRRAQHTLKESQMQYKYLLTSHLCRERIFGIRDILPGENFYLESDQDFDHRVNEFKKYLENVKLIYEKILVIGHSYHFSVWPEGRAMSNAEFRRIN